MQLADCLNSPLDNLIRNDSLLRGVWGVCTQSSGQCQDRFSIITAPEKIFSDVEKELALQRAPILRISKNGFGWEGSYTEPQRLLVCGAGIILQFCKLQHISASLVKLQNIGMVINRGIDLSCGPSVYLSEPPFRHESNIPRKIP